MTTLLFQCYEVYSLFFLSFFFLRAPPLAYGGSQARDEVQAAAATDTTAEVMPDP